MSSFYIPSDLDLARYRRLMLVHPGLRQECLCMRFMQTATGWVPNPQYDFDNTTCPECQENIGDAWGEHSAQCRRPGCHGTGSV